MRFFRSKADKDLLYVATVTIDGRTLRPKLRKAKKGHWHFTPIGELDENGMGLWETKEWIKGVYQCDDCPVDF